MVDQRRLMVGWGIAVLMVCGLGCTTDPVAAPVDDRLETLGRCDGFNSLREPFFGDTHVHTMLSLDANLQGNRLTPVDAYRFARGEEVGIQPYDSQDNPLRKLQLSRPLDFVAVSDHAEYLGVVKTCLDPALAGYDSAECEQYRTEPDNAFLALNFRLALPQGSASATTPCDPEDGGCPAAQLSGWNEIQAAAEAAYDRTAACGFTSFVAYEWSASPASLNLHRNVIFRNHVVPKEPTGYFDENFAEGLWRKLAEGCLDADGACDALAIPHNSNLSSGLMFETVDDDGDAIDSAYAQTRATLEPLVEIFQHKGDSECLPNSTAGDELCDFEKLPYKSLSKANLGGPPDEPDERDFLRWALGEGLRLDASIGQNPYQFGIIAGTDTHLGTPGAVEEDKFPGHGGAGLTVRDQLPQGLPDRAWFNPGGLAVFWAEENSREALFLAMRRREAYGTSGTRIVLRFFGGWGYDEGLCGNSEMVAEGYDGGVPMGGVLPDQAGDAPRFVLSAMRDSSGNQLSHVQIVKGWLEGGEPRWAVVEVAGDSANGADVELTSCTPQGEGADTLCVVWTDPDFDAAAPALYYARVVENPSCRWHVYHCRAGGVDCAVPSTITEGFEGCCEGYPPTQQERAWSSPIWYAP
jgi:hypothetical protein